MKDMIASTVVRLHPAKAPGRRGGPRGLRLVGAAALVAGATLAAFGGGRSLHAAMNAREVSGTYALNTVAGRPVPATAVDTTLADPWGRWSARLTIVLTGGTVRLTPSGRYYVDVAYGVKVNGRLESTQRYTDTGTYTADATGVTFTSPLADAVARGTVTDGALTVPGSLLGTEALRLRCLAGACTDAR